MSDLQPRKAISRSPSYPSIPLDKAVERAAALYQREGKYLAPIDSVLAHWGYTARGGGALRQLAALKKFGLTEEEGSRDARQIRLSQLGLLIVMPDSPGRAEALKEAAVMPTIHRDLRDKYPDGLPSDSTVRWYLKSDLGFTEKAAAELVAEFRQTIEFAGLEEGREVSNDSSLSNEEVVHDADAAQGATSDEGAGVASQTERTRNSLASSEGASLREVVVPLPGTEWIRISAEFPLSEKAWDQFLSMLAAMKPGLTSADPSRQA